MGRFFGVVAVLLGTGIAGGCTAPEVDAPQPEVALCGAFAGNGATLFMIFDPAGTALLADKPAEVVTLRAPSVEFNPWTAFSAQGDFLVLLDERQVNPEAAAYGSYHYGILGGESTPIFVRRGAGEFGFASADGHIWREKGGATEQIGESVQQVVVAPDGEKRYARTTRLRGSQAWLTEWGGKIMQVEAEGKLRQVGCVGWRRVTTPEGRSLGILMTKGMATNGRWAGRYEGKLYRDR
jgi:hypothetical protein